ncbi:MAG: toxin-antitoxin system YwqK family antitoxin [Chthoniobacterales bacterium]
MKISRSLLVGLGLLVVSCDDAQPPSDANSPTVVPTADGGAEVVPAPVQTESAATAATPSVNTEAKPAGTEAIAEEPVDGKDPIDMYDLDYDEENDRFLVVGSETGYDGPVFSVYGDGKTESTGALKDGLETGTWVTYFEDGTKESEGAFIQGLEDGPWKYFHENGNLESSGAYEEGSLVGRWTAYFEDGTVESDGMYSDGLMDGDWKFYEPESGEERVIAFENGREVDR